MENMPTYTHPTLSALCPLGDFERLPRVTGLPGRGGGPPRTLARWRKAGQSSPAGRTPGGHYRWRASQVSEVLGSEEKPDLTERAQDIESHVAAARAKIRRLRRAT